MNVMVKFRVSINLDLGYPVVLFHRSSEFVVVRVEALIVRFASKETGFVRRLQMISFGVVQQNLVSLEQMLVHSISDVGWKSSRERWRERVLWTRHDCRHKHVCSHKARQIVMVIRVVAVEIMRIEAVSYVGSGVKRCAIYGRGEAGPVAPSGHTLAFGKICYCLDSLVCSTEATRSYFPWIPRTTPVVAFHSSTPSIGVSPPCSSTQSYTNAHRDLTLRN